MASNVFRSRRRKSNNCGHFINLGLCLRKTRAAKSHDHHNAIVIENFILKMFSVHTKTQSWRF